MTDRIWIWFADNGNIRKWQRDPFEEGTEYLASLPPVDAEPVASDLVERLMGIAATPDPDEHYDLTPEMAIKTVRLLKSAIREAAAAIIALQGERDEKDKTADTLCNAVIRLQAEVARLKDELAEAHRVIEPFAEVAEWDIGDGEDDDDIFWPMSNARYSVAGRLRVKNLRRARSFRDGQKTGEKG